MPKPYDPAGRRREAAMRNAFAPLEVARPPARTSLDGAMPWELPGFTMKPKAQPPTAADSPLSVAECVRILRWIIYDPGNRTGKGGAALRKIPMGALASTLGLQVVTLKDWALGRGEPAAKYRAIMSPLLRKIDAGKVRCVSYPVPVTGGIRWEFEDVVDAALPQTQVRANLQR